MIKTGDQHMIGRFTSIPGMVYSSEMPDELLEETTLIENSMRLGRSPRESMFANWTMIAMMKGRGASFDKTEPQADWVVRLIDAKKKAETGEAATAPTQSHAESVGGTNAPPTLRHHDLQRDGVRLAAYLLGADYKALQRQQKELEKLSGKKIDIRKDGKQAILNRLEEARKTLAEQQAPKAAAALRGIMPPDTRDPIVVAPIGNLRAKRAGEPVDGSPPEQQVDDAEREKELFVATTRPLIDGLIAESRKNIATMCPGTVGHLATQLEEVLVGWDFATYGKRGKRCRLCGEKIVAGKIVMVGRGPAHWTCQQRDEDFQRWLKTRDE